MSGFVRLLTLRKSAGIQFGIHGLRSIWSGYLGSVQILSVLSRTPFTPPEVREICPGDRIDRIGTQTGTRHWYALANAYRAQVRT